MGKDSKHCAKTDRNYKRIMAQKRRRSPMRVVTDWTFTWPRGTDADNCDEHLDNTDLPRLGNNWIEVNDGAVTLYVSRTCKSVSVKLRNINQKRVTRVVISDGLKTVCWAINSGMYVVDGDYGRKKK